MDKEKRAREQAYQEYLKLRENRDSRGNYVKNDDLYGSYFSKGNSSNNPYYDEPAYVREAYEGLRIREKSESTYRSRSAVEDTPYGNSEMRRRSKRDQIARQGRINKADKEDKPAEPSKSRAKRKKKAEKKSRKSVGAGKGGRGLRVAVIVALILVLGIGGVIATGITVVKNTLDNVGRIELDPNLIGINPQVDEELKNYRNIALLGVDARDMENDAGVRSDAIIIVSIDKKTKEIKMFSVYRDTLVYQGEEVGLDKITHAYSNGGPTKVLYVLNKNLDLNIKEVVIVNWKSVADLVDALGGLDIEVLDSEIYELNYITEHTASIIGGPANEVTEEGMQTLDGNQSVAYARIRKDAATGDYRRNERMKIVVKATFDKAKTMDAKTIRKISKDIMPQIKTNMSTGDMMGLALNLTSYTMTDSVGFPIDKRDYSGAAFYCAPVTLESNVSKLHALFFAQEGYVPTTEVLDISEDISAETGYY
ncbi:MAG: LCP family protein [Bacillota bacterium]|nr:LCP family protein [Bacillota bacterium]